MISQKVLVVSAHAVDFVWRCGGTIAAYTKGNGIVKIIDLSLGARGEADSIWKSNPGITEENVCEIRRQEARNAAAVLGAQIEFYDWSDHPLIISKEQILQIAKEIKDFQPDYLLTHTRDPMNPDHSNVHDAVLLALRAAQVNGVFPEMPISRQTKLMMYEPDQPEFAGFHPDVYIDITDVMDRKEEAMQQITSQKYLRENYSNRAEYRSHLARRTATNPDIHYAEAFQQFYPRVEKVFN